MWAQKADSHSNNNLITAGLIIGSFIGMLCRIYFLALLLRLQSKTSTPPFSTPHTPHDNKANAQTKQPNILLWLVMLVYL